MPATIRDVAKLAGCSIKTVSRVVNNEPYVTEETRAKVQAAIRAVGYAPNISARRLAQNKSFMICILLYPGSYQAVSEMLMRIMDIGYEENYDILIQPYFPPHARSKRKLVSLIYEHRIDGIVTTPPCDADDFVADMLATYKVPQVQVTPLHPDESIPYVAGDDFHGAYLMTEYLIELGHQRISFLTGPRNMRASNDRLAGYRAALNDHRIAFTEELIRSAEWTVDGGYAMTRQLWELPERPSAIFAGNDETAFGVIHAAQEMGVSIPAQLSVCGYDDLRFAKNIWPPLTTVHQPAEEALELALRRLIAILKNKPIETNSSIIPAYVVLRASTGPPPAQAPCV